MTQSVPVTTPPELPASYHVIAEQVDIALARIRAGRSAKSILLTGLHGAGKTTALRELCKTAQMNHYITVEIAVSKNGSLPQSLIAPCHAALRRMEQMDTTDQKIARALRVLGSFIGTVGSQEDEDFSDLGTEFGLADNGNLESDLCDVFLAMAEAAKACNTVIALFIDDLHLVPNLHLSALISALHRCAQQTVPVILIGTGLPLLVGQTGKARSYSERLFEFYRCM